MIEADGVEVSKSKIDDSKSDTLNSEVKIFSESLPYWARYLAHQILTVGSVNSTDIEKSYSYLLEYLSIVQPTKKPLLPIHCTSHSSDRHKSDLMLESIENVQGVNALTENQKIVFNNNLTIIYGVNGSGKSGYVRLLKRAFVSKAPEDILSNVHSDEPKRSVNATFTFSSKEDSFSLDLFDSNRPEFEQFSVFDGKSVISHLEKRNEFDFRPAGLIFFEKLTGAIKRVEQMLNEGMRERKSKNDFAVWFDGESEVKRFVQRISYKTNPEEMQRFVPFSDADRTEYEKVLLEYDELLLATNSKRKSLDEFERLKIQLESKKSDIDKLNKHFSVKSLKKINRAIKDYLEFESLAREQGADRFKTKKVFGTGTDEWKKFLLAADEFARKQEVSGYSYPEAGDYCLLCLQPIDEESAELISSYWDFLRSEAEKRAKDALSNLDRIKDIFEGLNFDVFQSDNTLTVWLSQKFTEQLGSLKSDLDKQRKMAQVVVSSISRKETFECAPVLIDLSEIERFINSVDSSINALKEDDQSKHLSVLLEKKLFFEHKKKFNTHLPKFQEFIEKEVWVKKAERADFVKRKVTESEKKLSRKYFNQQYIDAFNLECDKLNGNFGVEVNHTGSGGKSYRQLKLKGKHPNSILSEGEQKVIAVADFLAEMKVSGINRGLIFDDPVTSLDEARKSVIARRLVTEAVNKQIVVFTHDLVFVSSLIGHCSDCSISHSCHWIENQNGKAGQVWLDNSPSFERVYRSAEPARAHYAKAKKIECSPMEREYYLKAGFTALRTCYEVLVIHHLFKDVVQRFNERVSVESLDSVYFDSSMIDEIKEGFSQCCRYMEGHTHSDRYAYKKPELGNLQEEIQRYEDIRRAIKSAKPKAVKK